MGRHARGPVVVESPVRAATARDRRRTHARRKQRRGATPVAAVIVAAGAGLGVVGQPVLSAAKTATDPETTASATPSRTSTPTPSATPTPPPVEAAPATPAAPPPPVEMTPSPEELAAIAAREAEAERAAREAERAALLPGCEASPDATDDYANGRIPESALCALPSGDLLRADAAFAFASMNAAFNEAFGEDICVGNTYRS